MARYKVLVQSFINDALVAEGEVVVLDDKAEVSDNLELIVEPKK
jgi:flagellar motor switch/type III secretory pathway protein FliN